MKQHKYRKELQNRTIKPSSNSWEKLNLKLTEFESNKTPGKSHYLKYAAVILVFISVGFYFFKSKEEVTSNSIIVSPTLKENSKISPKNLDETQSEVAATPSVLQVDESIKQKPEFNTKKNEIQDDDLAIRQENHEERQTTIETGEAPLIIDIKEKAVIANVIPSEEQAINDEVEQLLSNSKIKLITTNRITVQKEVSANALLNEVEDDLNKALKKILFEKIENTLKNPKEVVTTREN